MPRESFTTAYDGDRVLLDAVRAVAEHAAPGEPARCSQRAFNDSRPTAGHPDLPRADWIASRLKASWPELLAVIFDPGRSEMHWVALRSRHSGRRGLTLEAAAEALRWAARRLDASSVRPVQYERMASPTRGAAKKRHRHGSAGDFLLPTAAQIEHAVGWDAALAHAGLRPRGAAGGLPGLPRAEAMELFLREHGYLPSSPTLIRWAREQGFSMAVGRMEAAREQLRADRAALGRWTPPRALTIREAPRASPPPTVSRGPVSAPPPRRRRWTLEDVREGLLVAVEERKRRGDSHLTQQALKAISVGRPEIPSWASVHRVAAQHNMQGGQLLAEAEAEAARRTS